MNDEIVVTKRGPRSGDRSYMLKTLRALEHLGELYSATKAFTEGSDITVAMDEDPDTRDKIIKAKLVAQPERRTAAIAADCIHNMRQALDHLAYELAIFVSGSDPPPNEETSAFPIYDAIGPGKSVVLDDDRLRTKIGDPSKVPPRLRTILEGLQPYYGGDRLRLADLRDLDDIAKHRHLPVCAGVIHTGATSAGGSLQALTTGPLEVGETEVTRFPESEMEMEGTFTIDVVFGKDAPGLAVGEGVVLHLERTRVFLREAVIAPVEEQLPR